MFLKHPFTCIVAGPTGCGKPTLVKSIIEQNGIHPSPSTVLWLYAVDQPLYHTNSREISYEQGLPDDLESRINGTQPTLIVLDDLMTVLHSNERLTKLFTVESHHKNLSIIFISHNLFHRGKEIRNVSLNSHYIILFKNPRDRLQTHVLARQVSPSNVKFVIEAFEDATKQPHGYLLFDLKPETDERLRFRTNILPSLVDVVYI